MKSLAKREQKKKRAQDKALRTAYILGRRGKSHLQRRESVTAESKQGEFRGWLGEEELQEDALK